MPVDIDELVTELKALRKGRGLATPDILARVGPALRTVLGLPSAADSAQVRAHLTEALAALTARMPADFGGVVSTALALTETSHTRLYGERVDLVAGLLGRDPRTAIRRIDEGLRILAELAIAESASTANDRLPAPTPWRTKELRTWVVLDREVTEVYEMRRITTSAPELRSVRLELSVPVPAGWESGTPFDDPEIVVLSGGTLHTRANYSSSRIVFDLQLARPLTDGREHEFFVCFRFCGSRRMGPFYACTPSFPCDSFDLHVRFDDDHPPTALWKVDGLRMSEVDDSAAPRERIDIDGAGEVNIVFRGLTPNLSYGIAWDL